MASKIVFTKEQVLELLPHRDPFQFVDFISRFKNDKMIESQLELSGEEDFFKGHFPGNPVVPGVIITDALAQTSGLLYGFTKQENLKGTDRENEPPELFFLAAANVKYVSPAFPGDKITMIAYKDTVFGNLYTFKVEAMAGRKVIQKGTLTLALVQEEQ